MAHLWRRALVWGARSPRSSPYWLGVRTRLATAKLPSIHRTAAAVASGVGLLLAWAPGEAAQSAQMTENRLLGSRHRVGITSWAIRDPREQADLDLTAKSFHCVEDCFRWLKANGYECVEMTVDDVRKRWMPHSAPREIVRRVQDASRATGMPICGSLYHISDGDNLAGLEAGAPGVPPDVWNPQGLDFQAADFWDKFERKARLEKEIGSEYITFQLCLPAEHMNTGGAYRNDEAYLNLCAQRIARLQEICFRNGLNFYVETHIDRLSEDVEGFCKIFDRAPYFEVNADISHYNYRGITKGPFLQRINERVNHTHQRMARTHGDLSSDLGVHFSSTTPLGDADADWKAKGVTFEAFQSMKPGFVGGLSSRAIIGETGPAFSVKDALALDAKLVPLYRYMAEYADAQITTRTEQSNPFR